MHSTVPDAFSVDSGCSTLVSPCSAKLTTAGFAVCRPSRIIHRNQIPVLLSFLKIGQLSSRTVSFFISEYLVKTPFSLVNVLFVYQHTMVSQTTSSSESSRKLRLRQQCVKSIKRDDCFL